MVDPARLIAAAGITVELRCTFHRPEQSSEFKRYSGEEPTPEGADLMEHKAAEFVGLVENFLAS
jgi:hypothetical protein